MFGGVPGGGIVDEVALQTHFSQVLHPVVGDKEQRLSPVPEEGNISVMVI